MTNTECCAPLLEGPHALTRERQSWARATAKKKASMTFPLSEKDAERQKTTQGPQARPLGGHFPFHVRACKVRYRSSYPLLQGRGGAGGAPACAWGRDSNPRLLSPPVPPPFTPTRPRGPQTGPSSWGRPRPPRTVRSGRAGPDHPTAPRCQLTRRARDEKKHIYKNSVGLAPHRKRAHDSPPPAYLARQDAERAGGRVGAFARPRWRASG